MLREKIELQPVVDEDDPNENYPPKGTPETALIINLDEEQYVVLWHTGRFFHAQCECAGFYGMEIGIDDVPTDPGVWMFENGKAWTGRDWETGIPDECGISGDWRKATPEDFERAGLECPMDLVPSIATWCHECQQYPADLPDRLCPGCRAYKEHTA